MRATNKSILLAQSKGCELVNPSLSDLLDWVRDVKYLHATIFFSTFHKTWAVDNWFINIKKASKVLNTYYKDGRYIHYHEAQEEALENLLKTL